MEIPINNLIDVPYGHHQLFPHNPHVRVRQKGFGLCSSNLLMSNFKYSHMEEVTRYVAVVGEEGIPATSVQHDASF